MEITTSGSSLPISSIISNLISSFLFILSDSFLTYNYNSLDGTNINAFIYYSVSYKAYFFNFKISTIGIRYDKVLPVPVYAEIKKLL